MGSAQIVEIGLDRSARLDHLHGMAAAEVRDGGRRQAIRYQDVDLAKVGDLDRSRARELAAVRHEHDAARVFDDGAGGLDFADIEVEQGSVGVDGRGPDDGEVDAELSDEVDRMRPDDAAVALPDRAAEQKDFDRGVAVEFRRDVKVVGDDEETGMAREGARYFFGGGADIDEDLGMVWDDPGRRFPDQLLVGPCQHLAGVIGEVDHAGRHHGAPVHPHHHLGFAKVVEVPANGLGRHREMRRKVLDRDAALLAQPIDDFHLPARRRFARSEAHGCGSRSRCLQLESS